MFIYFFLVQHLVFNIKVDEKGYINKVIDLGDFICLSNFILKVLTLFLAHLFKMVYPIYKKDMETSLLLKM